MKKILTVKETEPQIFLDGTCDSDNPRAIELEDTYNYAICKTGGEEVKKRKEK